MSAARSMRSEDHFLCSICVDVFTDPVTTPCGHNFCKSCINEHWNRNNQYLCPLCNKGFNTKPELEVNTLLSEMVSQFRQEAQQKASSSSSEQQAAKPGEVPCDVCTGTKLKALKSCLVFLVIPVCLAFIYYWTEVGVRSSCEETVVKAVAQLEETLSKQMKKLVKAEVELKRVQQYAVDVTLDPDTANPKLILSADGKHVHHGDVWKNLPDNPERFFENPCVLGKQILSSGRFYFEVQVKEKTEWSLGVARESINRKGQIMLSPRYGYWTIRLRNRNEYSACNYPSVDLSLKSQPQKVGVFLDYEEGLVSFYDVDAAALIYSFTGCSFTEKLYPYFSPSLNYGGKNSAPLIICPVKLSESIPGC